MSIPAADAHTAPRTASEWLEAVVRAERRGELLSAFDLAEHGLAEHPGDVALQHRAVLALARAGSTEQAANRFESYGLTDVADEDVRALQARIAKDIALAVDGEALHRLAAQAGDLYEAIFADTSGYYPGINAATLRLLSGDGESARRLARRVLDVLRVSDNAGYYPAATEAEAYLVLNDATAAGSALERAAELHGGDYGAVATTRRQLRFVCDRHGIDSELLARLAPPRVVHYCGHRVGARTGDAFPADRERPVAAAIAQEIERRRPAYAYGSLASGADILFAEALLARGVELYVVLPFARDEFVETSVADAGHEWVERFERCLSAATDVSYATDGAYLGDEVLYRYGAELAMGLALLRTRYLDAEVDQLAVWDGGAAGGEAGTAVDVATWRSHGRSTTVITPESPDVARAARRPTPDQRDGGGRVVRALLFADVKGFSTLGDEQLPGFTSHVLGTLAEVLTRHGESVCYRNTWGDGIYAVLTGAVEAAACALDLQNAMASLDLRALDLPEHLALRLGAHLGPVFPVRDPVLGADAFMGSHVSRTARIEPVTPPGAVFVTEPFAAALELAASPFTCDYVGHMPAAKDFGRLRMYRLRRTAVADPGR